MKYIIEFEEVFGEPQYQPAEDWDEVKTFVNHVVNNQDAPTGSIAIYEVKRVENVRFTIGIEVGPS